MKRNDKAEMCWFGDFFREEKKSTTIQVGRQVRKERNYFYLGIVYPTSLIINCIYASD